MYIKSKSSKLVAMAVLCSILGVEPAGAQDRTSDLATFLVRVPYRDLNLDSEQGAVAMLRRIRSAARDVCSQAYGSVFLDGGSENRACVESAVERALAALNNPQVTALGHRPRGGVSTVLAAAKP